MGKSQRILRNAEIFAEITKLDIQYLNQLDTELTKLISTGLTTEEINRISMAKLCILLNLSCIEMHEYSDRYDRDYYSYIHSYSIIFKNKENIWKHISGIISEAEDKINMLISKFENPKKVLSIDNLCTKKNTIS